jgi:hypothetical protein
MIDHNHDHDQVNVLVWKASLLASRNAASVLHYDPLKEFNGHGGGSVFDG